MTPRLPVIDINRVPSLHLEKKKLKTMRKTESLIISNSFHQIGLNRFIRGSGEIEPSGSPK